MTDERMSKIREMGWQGDDLLTLHKDTPAYVLEKIAMCEEPLICKHITVHPNVTDEILIELSKSKNLANAECVLRSAKCPVSLLKKFAHHKDYRLRWAVACHKNTPPEILSEYARNEKEEIKVRCWALGHPSLPEDVYQEVVAAVMKKQSIPYETDEEAVELKQVIAGSPRTPIDVQLQLAADTKSDSNEGHLIGYRAVLAGSASDPAVLAILSDSDEYDICYHLALNNNVTEQILSKIIEKKDTNLLSKIISFNKNLTQVHLRRIYELIGNDSSLAKREDIPTDILREMAKTGSIWVRGGAAGNPTLPVDLWDTMMTDQSAVVRESLARNEALTAETLKKMSEDEDERVRRGVADNPNTSEDILFRLASDPSEIVRWGVANNPKTPLSTIESMVTDEIYNIRNRVAIKGKTASVLSSMTKDESEDVLMALIFNENLRDAELDDILKTWNTVKHYGLRGDGCYFEKEKLFPRFV